MGYRSDVVLAFALADKQQLDEVIAIYRMNPLVQKHDLVGQWKTHDWGDFVGLAYQASGVKWYEYYEDVQGIEHMASVIQNFATERVDVGEIDEDGKQTLISQFPFAYQKIRIGENFNDVEVEGNTNNVDLEDELLERVTVLREIKTSF